MQFDTMVQRACYEKIAPWIRELFGEGARIRDDVPLIDVTAGSARAQVGVFPCGQDEAVITTRAYLVAGASLEADLLRHLLRENVDRQRFGAFAVDADGMILFQHSIVGSTCDEAELRASVQSVAAAADQFDDEIIRRWGGERVASDG